MSARPRSSRAAYLQAGGMSLRMGENKAFLTFHGQTLLDRALNTLGEVCEDVAIIGDPAIFAPHGRAVADVFPNCGPLGGIHSALSNSVAELNAMLAVDMPFVTVRLLKFLFAMAVRTDAVVIVPRTSRGLQPLCAVYRPSFAEVAERSLKAGKYKIDAAFAGIPIHEINEHELAAAGFSEQHFFNVNTPEDRRTADDLKP